MDKQLSKLGYLLDPLTNVWTRLDYENINYSDGDEIELRLEKIVSNAENISVFSPDLIKNCTDWASTYHLSPNRANILRPFREILPNANVLEIGAGCGAITRYLGESNANVIALEGTIRRAKIARLRTRDLENVNVVAENFNSFEWNQKFDVITLIGVLEYANLFSEADNPHLAMLDKVFNLLKPDGKLIIGIENQLGIKYFAGAPEDHLGVPMYGIENRYKNNQVQTFGKNAIIKLLKQAKFQTVEFLAPFPDYKLPISTITENGFSCDNFDAATLAVQSIRRDLQLPSHLAFSPELTIPTIVNNGLGIDLANSFLIVAGNSRKKIIDPNILAYHFSTGRIEKYCKETTFVTDSSNTVKVEYNSLKSPSSESSEESAILNFGFPSEAEYFLGKPLSTEFSNLLIKDDWSSSEIGSFLQKYLSFVFSIISPNREIIIESVETKIPGECFDLVPQNIIVQSGKRWHIIDKEWTLKNDMPLGWLIFRTLLLQVQMISRFGKCLNSPIKTRRDFFHLAFNSLGLKINDRQLDFFGGLELEVQSEVSKQSINIYNWGSNIELLFNNLSSVIIEKDNLITDLGGTIESLIIDRDSQKTGFEHLQKSYQDLIVENDKAVLHLKSVINERDSLIADLGKTVESLIIDRDSQKTGFEHLQKSYQDLIVENDKCALHLKSIINERDSLIADLGETIESLIIDRDSWKRNSETLYENAQNKETEILVLKETISTIKNQVLELSLQVNRFYNSKSWRLTSPLRKLMNIGSGSKTDSHHKITQSHQSNVESNNSNIIISDSENNIIKKFRILLVSFYCPTKAHAGGLRILDIYSLIKANNPDVQIDLLTHHRPSIDWSLNDVNDLFDNVYLSPTERLDPNILYSLSNSYITYDLVDIQFHLSPKLVSKFSKIGKKIIFTPMESMAKSFFIDWRKTSATNSANPSLFKKVSLPPIASEEIEIINKVDAVVCVSLSDAGFLRYISGSRNIKRLDTGISNLEFQEALSRDFIPTKSVNRRCQILYVAYFGSETNIEALRWYLDNVHLLIKNAVPEYRFTVIGRGDLSKFLDYDDSVELVGEVPELAPHIRESRVCIAPAVSGSGFRGKINQYSIFGVPSVVSPIAAKGLTYKNKLNIFIAEEPSDFAHYCIQLLTDFSLNDQMGELARNICLNTYTWQSKWEIIKEIYNLQDI